MVSNYFVSRRDENKVRIGSGDMHYETIAHLGTGEKYMTRIFIIPFFT